MNLREPVIDYCERQSAAFWAEPLNAISNVAFLVAALAAFGLWRQRGGTDYPALALIVVTACVGVGSFIFHTLATQGAMLLDVIPIAVFIYAYFFLALRRFFGLGALAAGEVTLAFGVFSYFVQSVFTGLNGSVGYLPALGALLCFAALLWRADEAQRNLIAQRLGAAALVFAFSLFFRTIDRAICGLVPSGTHFLWHVLNACVLWLLLRAAILATPVAD